MSDFDYTRCPQIATLAPGGVLYIVSRFRYSHGDLDRDFSTVVVFGDNVYRHPWEPSTVVDFNENEHYYPQYLLFLNRTELSHVVDDKFIIVEVSEKKKLVRIGQGNAETGQMSNTIKFSISDGQQILDVRTVGSEIWLQADNNRMTILTPNENGTKINWNQVYTSNSTHEIGFKSFDLIASDSINQTNYPCRYSKCDQFCRDASHYKLGLGTQFA